MDELKDKNGEDIDLSSWEQEYVKDLPAQENGCVYFVYLCVFFCCPSESLHKGISFLSTYCNKLPKIKWGGYFNDVLL